MHKQLEQFGYKVDPKGKCKHLKALDAWLSEHGIVIVGDEEGGGEVHAYCHECKGDGKRFYVAVGPQEAFEEDA